MSSILLRLGLFGNALLAAACGVLMTMDKQQAIAYLGWQGPDALHLLGGCFLFFSVGLLVLLTKERIPTLQAVAVCCAGLMWFVAVFLVWFLAPTLMSDQGWLLTAGGTAMVGLYMAMQWFGIIISFDGLSGTYVVPFSYQFEATPEAMWEQVSDFKSIHHHAPDMVEAKLLTEQEQGVGAVRYCSTAYNHHWRETITAWLPGHMFRTHFHTEDAQFPYPFKQMESEWCIVIEEDGRKSIRMTWWFTPHSRLMMPMILAVIEPRLSEDLAKTVASYEAVAGRPEWTAELI